MSWILKRKWWLLAAWLILDVLVIGFFITRSSGFSAAKANLGRSLAATLQGQGRYYYSQKDYEKAERVFLREISVDRHLLPPNDPYAAQGVFNLARLYTAEGKHDKAEPLYRRALAMHERAYGRDSLKVATDLRWIAFGYREEGRHDLVPPVLERVVRIDEKVLGPRQGLTIADIEQLADAYCDVNDYGRAELVYERALGLAKSAPDNNQTQLSTLLSRYASLCIARRKPEKAIKLYKQALALEKAKKPLDERWLIWDIADMGYAYGQMHEYRRGEALLQQAVRMATKSSSADRQIIEANCVYSLSRLYYEEERYSDAERLSRHALSLDNQRQSGRNKWLAYDYGAIATACYQQKKYAEAEPLFLKSLAIQRKSPHPPARDVAWNLVWLGDVCFATNRFRQAERYYREGLPVASKIVAPDDPDRPKIAKRYDRYAKALRKLGKPDEAEAVEAKGKQFRAEGRPYRGVSQQPPD